VLELRKSTSHRRRTAAKSTLTESFSATRPLIITLTVGEHTVKVVLGRKEWARTVQITRGEIQPCRETEVAVTVPTPYATPQRVVLQHSAFFGRADVADGLFDNFP
jgi:hypothetical protein